MWLKKGVCTRFAATNSNRIYVILRRKSGEFRNGLWPLPEMAKNGHFAHLKHVPRGLVLEWISLHQESGYPPPPRRLFAQNLSNRQFWREKKSEIDTPGGDGGGGGCRRRREIGGRKNGEKKKWMNRMHFLLPKVKNSSDRGQKDKKEFGIWGLNGKFYGQRQCSELS